MDGWMDGASYHFGWLEPSDIHGVVKHVFDNCKLLSNSNWMARKDNLEIEDGVISGILLYNL